MPSVSYFEHTPLDAPESEIRLLRILPSSLSDTPVRCAIETFSIDECPPYRALSYAWGPPTSPVRSILVNNKEFTIRDNLWQCLSQFQSDPEPHRFLWIDQICIDQKNIHERNQQVRLMEEVYRGAVQVEVWLGAADSSCEEAMQFLIDDDDDGGHAPPAHVTSCLNTLFSLPYWSRLWIVQEILLARRVVLHYGPLKLPWRKLQELASSDSYYGMPHNITSFLLPAGTNSRYSKVRDNYSLMIAMTLFSGQGCADPRDKVYGLMGIVEEDERLDVDYEKAPRGVLLDAIEVIMKRLDEDVTGATQWELTHVVSVREVVEKFWKLGEEMGLEAGRVEELAVLLEQIRSRHVLSWPGHS